MSNSEADRLRGVLLDQVRRLDGPALGRVLATVLREVDASSVDTAADTVESAAQASVENAEAGLLHATDDCVVEGLHSAPRVLYIDGIVRDVRAVEIVETDRGPFARPLQVERVDSADVVWLRGPGHHIHIDLSDDEDDIDIVAEPADAEASEGATG